MGDVLFAYALTLASAVRKKPEEALVEAVETVRLPESEFDASLSVIQPAMVQENSVLHL